MSILDELKKWTHPYEDEDEEEEEFQESSRREPVFDDRKAKAEEGGQYPCHHPVEGGAGEAGAV